MQKENLFFFSFPSAKNFGEARVTKKREQNKTKSFMTKNILHPTSYPEPGYSMFSYIKRYKFL